MFVDKISLLRHLFDQSRSKAIRMAEQAFRDLAKVRKKLYQNMKLLKRIEKQVTSRAERNRRESEVESNRLERISEVLREDMDDWKRSLEQANTAMEGLRSANEVFADITVPGLIDSCKELQACSEANIAMFHSRRAAATPHSVEGDY